MALDLINIPIDLQTFVTQFEQKFQKWGNHITKELKETWKQNCLVFNNVIAHKDKALKYIVSAPTGSAKTENTITYCAMLPKEIKVLISTNLIDEADRIAADINQEAAATKAVAFHSKNKITLKEALTHQIVVVTHAFYKNHTLRTHDWKKIAYDVNLVIIDEAINTIQELSLTLDEVTIALNLFEVLHRQLIKNDTIFNLFAIVDPEHETYFSNNLLTYETELTHLAHALEEIQKILTEPQQGTNLLRSNQTINISDAGDPPCLIEMFTIPKYQNLIKILKHYPIPYNQLLTGVKDESNDATIKNNILLTLDKLNELEHKQAYTTSHNGTYSLNRVKDYLPRQSIACLDATADVNKLYNLRQQYHKDIIMVPKVANVRDYSTVNLYTKAMSTSKKNITEGILKQILTSLTFGAKTLFVVNKKNLDTLRNLLKNDYTNKKTDVASWGSLTGLNKWKDYDTCVIIGLNHKSKQYLQNRNIVHTNENIAFGSKQNDINKEIEISDLVAEIVQAMNRIRIRKVTNDLGQCDSANIYLTLPTYSLSEYQALIQQHMSSINMLNWDIALEEDSGLSAYDQLIGYLNTYLNSGDKILITSPRDTLKIKSETYRSLIGKTKKDQDSFKEKIKKLGYEILEIQEVDGRGRARKKPREYFHKM